MHAFTLTSSLFSPGRQGWHCGAGAGGAADGGGGHQEGGRRGRLRQELQDPVQQGAGADAEQGIVHGAGIRSPSTSK